MENLISIKKISGDILLYMYSVQRCEGFSNRILSFQRMDKGVKLSANSDFEKDIFKIADNSAVNLYNAIRYLEEKSFIDFNDSGDTGGDHFVNIHVTAFGVDIIEGIERDNEAREKFNITFNIKLADNINIESLIKNELSSLVKLGLI